MKTIKQLIILSCTFLLAWFLPWAYRLATDKPNRYPFSYYSSIVQSFCITQTENSTVIRSDARGNTYSEAEFDSILPMFYSHQLAKDSRLPDSIHGRETTLKIIATGNFFFRYKPVDQYKPTIPLYPLFESIPRRVDLEMPGDVFKVTDRITFIDPVTNTVNREKSDRYSALLDKKGFEGPARLVAGTPTTRKAYDEGYFIVDRNARVFHLKMVNGKPFIRDTGIDPALKTCSIFTTEYPSHLFYGFLFSDDGRLFTIGTDDYKISQVPTPAFHMETDDILIMGNMFNWNVRVGSDRGQELYALDAETMEKIDSISFPSGQPTKVEWNQWLFPFILTFTSANDAYVMPRLNFTGYRFLVSGVLFAFLLFIVTKRKRRKISPAALVWVAATGLYGFLSGLLFDN